MPEPYFEPTQSLCPVCLRRLDARREIVGEDGFLVKTCPEHGTFRARFWHGPPGPAGWNRPKVPGTPPPRQTAADRGCPFDCGLCPEHGQHTCTAVFEVTGRCNLGCPVCFAGSGVDAGPDPGLDEMARRFEAAFAATGPANVQLSGGEPTVRADLPDLVKAARRAGYAFIQVNTNGLALAEDPDLAARLAEAGLDSVFLQFDGVTDDVYRRLRGRDLLAVKLAAIERLAAAGIGIVLVPTVVAGVNDGQVGDLTRLAVSKAPAVRGIHFQPAGSFGRYPWSAGDDARYTLPELMTALEGQTRGMVTIQALHPPCCEHSLCSFSATFLLDGKGGLGPVWAGTASCCSPPASPLARQPAAAPIRADEGSRQAKDFVARQWGPPPPETIAPGPVDDFARFLEKSGPSKRFSVSAMGFQDAWTLDLERARGCCIHVVTPRARLVPFCLYNLTAADGKPLYRER
jgi:7,8-dihydro-6-hydroxymethylpterin dimethyltransferase